MILFLCCCVMVVAGLDPRNDTLDGFVESSGEDYDDFDYELEQVDNDEDYVEEIIQKIGDIDQT